jgi:hypothetical protein
MVLRSKPSGNVTSWEQVGGGRVGFFAAGASCCGCSCSCGASSACRLRFSASRVAAAAASPSGVSSMAVCGI